MDARIKQRRIIMIVQAEVNQLYKNGLFMNIINPDGSMIGVWSDESINRTILYKGDRNDVWFMQFKDDTTLEEFEKAYPLLKRIYDSKK